MKIRQSFIPALCLVGMLLLMRLAWRASNTEIGWESLIGQWTTTPARILGLPVPAITEREPEDQAQFWLANAKTLDVAKTDSVEIALGAAWMLDRPQTGSIAWSNREIQRLNGIPRLPFPYPRAVDFESMIRAERTFVELCREECLAAADRSVQLDPENVDTWRTRAMLAFVWDFREFRTRRGDWEAVLDEGAIHDPDNALYDYLAAINEWHRSTQGFLQDGADDLRIRDQQGFERGQRWFEAGTAKRFLALPKQPGRAVVAFLAKTDAPRMELLSASQWAATANTSDLLIDILRWQRARSDDSRRNKDNRSRSVIAKQTLKVASQLGSDALFLRPYLQQSAFDGLAKLAAETPADFSPTEVDSIAAGRLAAELDRLVSKNAVNRVSSRDLSVRGRTSWITILALGVQPFAAMMLLFAGVVSMIAWLLHKSDYPVARVQLARMGLAWLLGGGLSFAIYGIFPAEIISSNTQSWIIGATVIVGCPLFALGLIYYLSRTLQFELWQVLSLALTCALPWVVLQELATGGQGALIVIVQSNLLLLAVLILAAVLLAAIVVRTDIGFLRTPLHSSQKKTRLMAGLLVAAMFTVPWIPKAIEAWPERGISVPAQHDDDYDRFWSENPGLRAILQWYAYSGPVIGAGLTITVLIVSSTPAEIRRAGGWKKIFHSGKRRYAAHLAHLAAKSLSLAGTCALLAYFAAMPTALTERQAEYEHELAQVVNPTSEMRAFEAEMTAIREDLPLMDQLRDQAIQRLELLDR